MIASANNPSAALAATDTVHIFSICSRNYLPQARRLFQSVTEAMPSARLTLVLADEAPEVEKLSNFVGAEVVLGSQLGIPTYYDMAMRYDIVEFNTALKPASFAHLFSNGAQRVIYLDPDIEVFRSMTEVTQALEEGANAVITPHICQPLDMEFDPTEVKLLRTGVYNLGFCAIANTPEGCRFVDWWSRRMATDCRVDLDAGIFVDQKYVDLMPSYLPHTNILRHPGYNVAYWNLAHRSFSRDKDGAFYVNGQPLAFMHFSGIRAKDPKIVSVHQNRVEMSDLGEGQSLFSAYRQRIVDNRKLMENLGISGQYAYGKFVGGEDIPDVARSVYSATVPPLPRTFEEVFDLKNAAFVIGPSGLDHENAHLVSPVMADLWRRKPHLQATFDIRKPRETEAFALWFAETGFREWRVPEAFIPEAVVALKHRRRSLKASFALSALNLIERLKWFSFMYPKPVRRAAVRWSRKVLPHLIKRIRAQ